MLARAPGQIAIEPRLRARIVELRCLLGVSTPPTLAVDVVQRIESELKVRLSDEVLALLASRVVIPHEKVLAVARAVRSVDQTSEDAVPLPAHFVALGRAGRLRYFCVERVPPEHRPGLYMFDANREGFGGGDHNPCYAPTSHWLEEAIRVAAPASKETGAPPPADELVPQLVALRSSRRLERKVNHARFGSGKVIRSFGGAGNDEKLEVDFVDGGVRVLLARYVEPAKRRRR